MTNKENNPALFKGSLNATTSERSGNPIWLQNECAVNGAAKCPASQEVALMYNFKFKEERNNRIIIPVLTKRKAAYAPNSAVYANWKPE